MSLILNLVIVALIYFLAGAIPIVEPGFVSFMIWAAIVFGAFYLFVGRYPAIIQSR